MFIASPQFIIFILSYVKCFYTFSMCYNLFGSLYNHSVTLIFTDSVGQTGLVTPHCTWLGYFTYAPVK